MDLKTTKFLILDCQTTDRSPRTGQILELSWSFVSAESERPFVRSELMQIPSGSSLPKTVKAITGIVESDLDGALSAEDLQNTFLQDIAASETPPFAIAHFAQFERSFLVNLFAGRPQTLPFEFLCTYQIARRVFPNSPSRSVRGLLGYLNRKPREIKRGKDHVFATWEIWTCLVKELDKAGISSLEDLKAWLSQSDPVKREKIEYHIDKERRLSLPKSPGVYRLISQTGAVLYVGKATNLKDRVNSYFRGIKGRNSKKLEMLAQARDIDFTVCGSVLEASLLEADEIKRLDPPYNVSLKAAERHLIFYSRDFSQSSREQSSNCSLGPFREKGNVEQLRILKAAIDNKEVIDLYFETVEAEILANAYEIFLDRHRMEKPEIRSLLALGLKLLRARNEELDELEAELSEDPESLEEDLPLTAEEVADHMESLLVAAALDYVRSKVLTGLLDSSVSWQDSSGAVKSLHLAAGRVANEETQPDGPYPWAGLGISEYDRMVVLRAELKKLEHTVQKRTKHAQPESLSHIDLQKSPAEGRIGA